MNENLLDVLLYLFEHFPMPDSAHASRLRADLNEAGFFPEEIDDALSWIRASQADRQTLCSRPDDQALRLYSPLEQQLLSPACQGYLARLQHCGVLTAAARETVIDRLLALADNDDSAITVEQLKWVVMMILSSNGEDEAFAHMEALLHAEQPAATH
ncbi:MAG TPA: DUF494 domain-containing protein [Salinisphaeraceae bacterium]|nr:DUF494 domain-containing protein [Salinisphaeraceae bacterium]